MLNIIMYSVLLLLSIPVLHTLMFSLGGLFYRLPKVKRSKPRHKICIYIPAYREDAVIVSSVKNVLKQKYYNSDKKMYDIVVIAQHLKESTLKELYRLNCKVVKFNAKNSTKVKALQFAINAVDPLHNKYDIALILDADNHLGPNFLLKINDAFSAGHKVIQGHRTAKNLNTKFAHLDAASEEINNTIFRKGLNFFGYSALIIGSGVAFENKIFIDRINESNAVSGFDKEIDNEIVKRNIFITYLNDAFIYDEKVQDQKVFENQRTRWIEAQIRVAKDYVWPSIKDLFKRGNVDFFIKATLNLLPPRIILLGSLFLITVLVFFIDMAAFKFSAVLFSVYIFALCIAVPKKLWTKQLLMSLIKIPNAFFSMILSTLKIKKSKNTFIHTPHGVK